jgi:hypothetical protein
MISLFNIPDYIIDTSKFKSLLHDDIVTEFENNFASYVGAKYAVEELKVKDIDKVIKLQNG